MNNISVFSVDPEEAVRNSDAIAIMMPDAFGSEPWFEAFLCRVCNASFGSNTKTAMCCGQPLSEYYPLEETSADIRRYLSLTQARIAVALNNASWEELAGFAYGYKESLNNLNESKFNLEPRDMQMLQDASELEKEDQLFYFSEFGVKSTERGKGIGKELYNTLFSSVDSSKTKGNIMRTSRKSPAYIIASNSQKYPFKVMYEYRDALERVILTKPVS